ncbi:hypothetical protein SERLA73DRAFT_68057 [Serpula lacrymans var. lacrymans S7.3]|uniref:Uncharacterized protein n=2 Tax=Serpula lacrymans var. lacrymans TaxID=341189 RepID=F8PGL6_SERL3|nr:uncharacterized protein SERLADRAFT_431776 [Serpula lacrymans var. lacrymans S7.9]EGO04360.1 hypothetical protein SERLA73DRAFT_68057 [Serpula lacrymans var. lacrymans S7.3]EGO30273.1 hypothetical protein SERLADRAFT_431776 [Serpula lacrymans var. lacrymans S7.9]
MLEEELLEWEEGSGISIPTPRWLNRVQQCEEHPRPTRQHSPSSLPQPQPVVLPSTQDLTLPAPVPSSPAASCATNSIIPKANTLEESQETLIPMRPTTPLLTPYASLQSPIMLSAPRAGTPYPFGLHTCSHKSLSRVKQEVNANLKQ